MSNRYVANIPGLLLPVGDHPIVRTLAEGGRISDGGALRQHSRNARKGTSPSSGCTGEASQRPSAVYAVVVDARLIGLKAHGSELMKVWALGDDACSRQMTDDRVPDESSGIPTLAGFAND